MSILYKEYISGLKIVESRIRTDKKIYEVKTFLLFLACLKDAI